MRFEFVSDLEFPASIHTLVSMMSAPWHWGWSAVTIIVARGHRQHGWSPRRGGYNYYTAALPGTVAPVAYTAGKGDYQDSEYDC